VRQVTGSATDQLAGKALHRLVSELGAVEVRKRLCLAADGVGNVRVAVAQRGYERATHGVEPGMSFGVVDPAPLTPRRERQRAGQGAIEDVAVRIPVGGHVRVQLYTIPTPHAGVP